MVGFVAIGPSKPFHRHDAHKQLGPRVCLAFGEPFCRDLCFGTQFRFQARGTFGEAFCRNLCFGKRFRFQARGTLGEPFCRDLC